MKPSFLISIETEEWHIAAMRGEQAEITGAVPAGDVAAALELMRKHGYDGSGVCVGVPSDKVLTAVIDCAGLPRKQRRSAMLFRLEDQLPLDIDSLTADFVATTGGKAMGVAVETAHLRETIDKLADSGIETTACSPTAMLALLDLLRDAPPTDFALVVLPGRMDLFRLHEKQPVAWYTVADVAELARCLRAEELANPTQSHRTTACVLAETEWFASVGEDHLDVTFAHRREEPALAAAVRTAARALGGEPAGWVEFRQDALAHTNPWGRQVGLLKAAAALAVVLLVTLIGTLQWRAYQYGAASDEASAQQTAVFHTLYPDMNAPQKGAVRKRLESDLKRLAGVSGVTSEVPKQVSALDALRQVALSFPEEGSFHILEMRIGPNDIYLEGQCLQHADAESLRGGLSRGGFNMEAPKTEALSTGGVTFTVRGKIPEYDKTVGWGSPTWKAKASREPGAVAAPAAAAAAAPAAAAAAAPVMPVSPRGPVAPAAAQPQAGAPPMPPPVAPVIRPPMRGGRPPMEPRSGSVSAPGMPMPGRTSPGQAPPAPSPANGEQPANPEQPADQNTVEQQPADAQDAAPAEQQPGDAQNAGPAPSGQASPPAGGAPGQKGRTR